MDSKKDLEQKARSIADKIGIHYELVSHSKSGEITADAVDALGEEFENIIKCLILKDKNTGKVVGVIIRGDTKLDLKLIQKITGFKKLQFASPEFINEFTGFKIGGVPAFIIYKCDRKLVCDLIFQKDYVIGSGGHTHCGAKFKPDELRKIAGIEVERISK